MMKTDVDAQGQQSESAESVRQAFEEELGMYPAD
jgi:hypothetical protein